MTWVTRHLRSRGVPLGIVCVKEHRPDLVVASAAVAGSWGGLLLFPLPLCSPHHALSRCPVCGRWEERSPSPGAHGNYTDSSAVGTPCLPLPSHSLILLWSSNNSGSKTKARVAEFSIMAIGKVLVRFPSTHSLPPFIWGLWVFWSHKNHDLAPLVCNSDLGVFPASAHLCSAVATCRPVKTAGDGEEG